MVTHKFTAIYKSSMHLPKKKEKENKINELLKIKWYK